MRIILSAAVNSIRIQYATDENEIIGVRYVNRMETVIPWGYNENIPSTPLQIPTLPGLSRICDVVPVIIE